MEFDFHIHDSLIRECREGNRRAQKQLYDLYCRAMFNLAYRIMNNREDAEDILQDTFIDCFRNLESFRFESTFGAWLKRILVNKCINQIKKKKIDLELYDSLPSDGFYENDNDEENYDVSGIIKAIELLPDGYRIILTLYLLEGYDHEEIAQILGISESTSKSQYSRAKEKIRNIISNRKKWTDLKIS